MSETVPASGPHARTIPVRAAAERTPGLNLWRLPANARGVAHEHRPDTSKRGKVLPSEPEPEGKTRITIRLDQDIVDRFFAMAEASGAVAISNR